MRTKNHLEFGSRDGIRRIFSKKHPRESEDVRRAKRVRFADVETDYPLSRKNNACSINAREPPPSRCADPKTSEYAFYRKLREDASHNFHSYQLLKHGNKQKESEANGCVRELDKLIEPNQAKFTSLFPFETTTPSELLCHSPYRASKKTGIDTESCRSITQNTDADTPYSELDKPDEGIFSKKRRRLRQLAAASLNLNIEECQFKGCDLVSVLLQRLVPEYDASSSNSCVEHEPRSRHKISTTKTTKPWSPYKNDPCHLSSRGTLEDKNILFEEPSSYARPNTSPFAVSYLKNSSPDCLSNREIAFSKLGIVDSDYLLTGSHEKLLIEYERKPENGMDFGIAPCLHSYQRSVLGFHLSTEFSFPGHGYFPVNTNLTPARSLYSTCNNLITYGEFPDTSLDLSSKSYETFDGLVDANEPKTGKGGCAYQVLDWDANRINNEEHFSISSDFETMDINWMTPFHQREAQAEPLRLCSEAALATWPCPDSQVCNLLFESCPVDVAGTQVANGKSCQLVQADSLLSSPCNLSYFRILEESSWLRGKHEWSSHCSPSLRDKCMNEVFEEKVPSNTDSLLLYSRHHLDFEWKSLPISDFTAENSSFASFSIQALTKDITMLSGDITDVHWGSLSKPTTEVQLAKEMFLSPLSFRVSLDEKWSWPLLLDKSSWDRSEGAAHHGGKEHWPE
ncbi:hypothetical protein Sjap_006206 [Stephania japonica]|uniref:Uncharacterized protein n=1 Tax=Stephania japonica TaxID=461633 RepID=A0AAP0PIP5_9MAGN